MSSTQLKFIYHATVFSLILQLRLLFSFAFYSLRICVELVACRTRPELRRILSSNHFLSPDGNLFVGHNQLISFKIRGLINIQDFKKEFLTKCVLKRDEKTNAFKFPELQEQIEIYWGYPFWKRSIENNTFNIDKHVSGGEAFQDMERLDEEACSKIEKIVIKREFQRSEGSPWKIYILHENGTNTTRLLFVFHQSLGNGQDMYELLMRLTSKDLAECRPNTSDQEYSWTRSNRELLSPRNRLLILIRLIRNLWRCRIPPPFHVPQNKLISQDARFIVKTSEIKKSALNQLSQRSSVPFLGVLMSSITGGLRNFLEDQDLSIPDFVLCTLQANQDNSRSNGLSTYTRGLEITLPFGLDDAKDRLYDCREALIESQASAFPLIRLELFMENAYPLALKPSGIAMSPIMLSWISGPESCKSILDEEHEILDMDFAWNGTKYASIIFTTITYRDQIRVVLTADPKAFQFEKEMELFGILEYIEAEITYMQKYKYKNKKKPQEILSASG